MVGDPTVSAASLTLTSILKIFGKYQAYQSSKLRETDRGLREEIQRRLVMIDHHLNTLDARYLSASNAQALETTNRIRNNLNAFIQDATWTPAGTTDSESLAPALKKGQVKTLMEHDLEVLKRLVESTHLVNAMVEDSAISAPSPGLLEELEQKLVGCRNRFSDRTSFITKI